ncbi:hypothetical protein [Phthorimaea operculella granulovirus]|uniref:P33 n=1 Tax=Phthorimaea operculella granulovirus TaxID=192584 RepID=Q8JRX4_9BBAC|nr:hypothetical protein [Phthorimaea operculella granulovirus]AAM70283.1 hypothetical protein [Phthorimaea operculella granulovirus]ANY57474.1 hypothetical protein PhopGVgp085 [Phthorimaea operculella granulovirus]QBH65920.1 hypothetical protein PhopGVgp085 [Phthorimaea operculella granulovirus]QBH66050.1 hypothetical protein PhopGVgp085 [Phthorimaea operculella granulovirus]QBH66180.1 hypothetical protein PhopGVgp085 [Phthorimaea operculella granulovirus]
MLVETQTVLRYKESFSLFVYRILDMVRMAPSHELRNTLKNEVRFLYGLLRMIKDVDTTQASIDELIEWSAVLGSDIPLDVFKDMYTDKLKRLNLSKFEPQKFVFTFSTIWDCIHLLCLMCDDAIINRHNDSYENILSFVRNLKWVYYNIFIVLFCPVCARHYLTVNTFPFELERIEIALYREHMGEPIQMVDECINRSQSHKNVLYRHHLVYVSMLFHNHVNGYRPIQHKKDDLNRFQRMEWGIYKNLLGLK